MAAGNVAAFPVLASEALLAAFEHAVVWRIVGIQGTPVAMLLVDCRAHQPQSLGPSLHDQPWFTPACAAACMAWQAVHWAGESGDVVTLARQEFHRVCR